MTGISKNDLLFQVFCPDGVLPSVFTTLPQLAAVNSNLITQNNYEHHTTLIGFIAADKAPHL